MARRARSLRDEASVKVRRLLIRADSPEVRHARRLIQRLRADPPLDVLALGDSAWVWTAPYDSDKRTLFRMMSDLLGEGVATHQIAGPGYHPGLFEGYVRVVHELDQRPCVVIPLCARLQTVAWWNHPYYSFRAQLEVVRAIDVTASPWRIRAAMPYSSNLSYVAYDRLRISTLAGDRTVGEFRDPLKNPAAHGLTPADREKLLYAFHHGEALSPDAPSLNDLHRLGVALRDADLPFVLFETPAPVERGVEHYGTELEVRVRANLDLMRRTLSAGYGSELPVVQSGTCFPKGEFLDPADATEHLNDRGRLRLAEMLAAPVREALARR